MLVYTVLEQVTESKRREMQKEGNGDFQDAEFNAFEVTLHELDEIIKSFISSQVTVLQDYLQTSQVSLLSLL